jgi:raffinose/stachyose/melibiose transport system permease protein
MKGLPRGIRGGDGGAPRAPPAPRRIRPPHRTARRRRGRGTIRRYGHLWFVLPGLLVFLAFIVYPTLSAFWLSLYDWRGVGKTFNFIGLGNFERALASADFYRAAGNNLVFFVAILLFQHTVGLFTAVQLNARPRFMEVYRTILFLPVILSLIATGFIWTLILSPNIGLLNPLLARIGLGFLARPWLSDTTFALPAVILVQAWNILGWSVVIYLAGLQNIPVELRQAAEIDGARPWQTFRRVIFPLLSPSFTALTVLTFIQIFRVFDVVYVLTGPVGAPAGRTDVLGTLVYRTAFGVGGLSANDARMSYAIAISVLIFIMMAAFSALLILLLRRREIEV